MAGREETTALTWRTGMLILSRKLDEVITIGDDVEVKIVRISKDVVKLGIAAPKNVAVHRKEIARRIEEKLHRNDNDERDK